MGEGRLLVLGLVGTVMLTSVGCVAKRTQPAPATSQQSSDEQAAAQAEAEAEAAAERDPNALPAAFDSLALSDPQRDDLLQLRAGLRSDWLDLVQSAKGFLRASAPSVRRCRGDSPSIGLAAERVILTGNRLRGPLLNSVDEMHRILTPKQRKALVARLLADDDERESDSGQRARSDRNDSAIKSFGERIDLSLGQMLKLLLRLSAVRDDFNEQLNPWREPYRQAVRAFAQDSFSARDQRVAKAPAAKIVVGAARKAMRVAVPLLDPEQCETLADAMLEQANRP